MKFMCQTLPTTAASRSCTRSSSTTVGESTWTRWSCMNHWQFDTTLSPVRNFPNGGERPTSTTSNSLSTIRSAFYWFSCEKDKIIAWQACTCIIHYIIIIIVIITILYLLLLFLLSIYSFVVARCIHGSIAIRLRSQVNGLRMNIFFWALICEGVFMLIRTATLEHICQSVLQMQYNQ